MRYCLVVLTLLGCGSEKGSDSATGKPDAVVTVQDQTSIKGERGERGEQGARGDKGDSGDTGAIGAVGASGESVAGPAGKDAEPLPLNQWYDPIAQIYWLITPDGDWATGNLSCTGDWALPTVSQAITAINHGLFIASNTISGSNSVWTSESNAIGTHVMVNGTFVAGADDADNIEHGIFCRKKEGV